MPEPVTTETVVTSTSTETTPLSQREAAYQRLYASEHQETTTTEPPPEPVVIKPIETTSSISPDFAALIREAMAPVLEKVSTLEARSKPADAAPVVEKTWVDYLREGDTENFEKSLVQVIEAAVSQRVTQTAKAESLVEFDTRQALTIFINDIRSKNTDIIEEESWISSLAGTKLQAAQSAGKITDHASYIKEYQTAVTEAVDEIRKRIQRYRATGKEEAMTTRREVLSSSPLTPQQMPERGKTDSTPSQPDVSPESYIAKRQARLNAARGLSN